MVVYSGSNTDCKSSEPLKTIVMLCYVMVDALSYYMWLIKQNSLDGAGVPISEASSVCPVRVNPTHFACVPTLDRRLRQT